MGLKPLGVLQPHKEGHEKPATAKGRPEERSLLTATGLFYPERQPFHEGIIISFSLGDCTFGSANKNTVFKKNTITVVSASQLTSWSQVKT